MDDPALIDPRAGSTTGVTVVLGEHDAGMRAGVRHALESGGVRVVAEAETAEEAHAAAVEHRPAACLLAVHLPGSGITAAGRIKVDLPDTKIVMLTGSDRNADLFASIRAGADGYLLKTTSAARLAKAIEGVLAGEAAIPRRLTARLVQDYRSHGRMLRLTSSGRRVAVTAREVDVITRLREGESTAEIARDLGISDVTVRRHISSIEHKLRVQSRRAVLAVVEDAELDVLPMNR